MIRNWFPAPNEAVVYRTHVIHYIVRNIGGVFCNPVDYHYTNGRIIRYWQPVKPVQRRIGLAA